MTVKDQLSNIEAQMALLGERWDAYLDQFRGPRKRIADGRFAPVRFSEVEDVYRAWYDNTMTFVGDTFPSGLLLLSQLETRLRTCLNQPFMYHDRFDDYLELTLVFIKGVADAALRATGSLGSLLRGGPVLVRPTGLDRVATLLTVVIMLAALLVSLYQAFWQG